MYRRNEIDRKEALSKVTFSNAERFFVSQGVRGLENIEKSNYYADMLKRYINYLSS
jgi:hypothetical protein